MEILSSGRLSCLFSGPQREPEEEPTCTSRSRSAGRRHTIQSENIGPEPSFA